MTVEGMSIVEVVGTVVELHPKSGPTWARAKVQTLQGAKWVVAKFGLEVGETLRVKCTHNPKFHSYDVVELCTDSVPSAEVVACKMMERMSGFGKVRAARLVEAYPDTLWEKVCNSPNEVAEVCGLLVSDVEFVAAGLKVEQTALSRVSELMELGYPNALAKRVAKTDSHYRIGILTPYPLVPRVVGMGWLTADEIGIKMGIPLDDPERIEQGVRYFWSDKVSGRGNTRASTGYLLHADALPAILGLPHTTDYAEILHAHLQLLNVDPTIGWWTMPRHFSDALAIKSFFSV